jgi:cytochrome c oxidase cbb3-type subunit 2
MGDSEQENGESSGVGPRFESIVPVLIGAILVIALGWGLAVAAPAGDPSYTQPSAAAEQKKVAALADTPQARGRKLYISQGCYSCHTQQVRAVITDAYLGPASAAGDYAYDDPVLLGGQRIGPDLSHIASRKPGDNRDDLTKYLRDPQKDRPWSTMPSYSHLTDEEMADLVAYLQSLK